ncbi:hypothetical protein FIBSPDRAFT_674609, partial [Athelia psychrophila]
FLPTGWEDKLKSQILSMRQGDQGFWEWCNSMTVKNMLLKNMTAHCSVEKICEQLTANMTETLVEHVRYEGANKEPVFEKWVEGIHRIND